MADNNRLRAIGPGSPDGNAPADAETPSEEAFVLEDEYAGEETWDAEQFDEPEPRRPRLGWVLPTLAILAVLAWTGFFAWVNQRALLGGASPAQWSRWIVDWSVPVVLVVGLWLLAMRNSRRESARFASAAQALATESQNLERRLTVVNRELSLAREFIAAQSRDLESLGRIAAERLSQNADRLQGLIRDNGEQVEQIGRVSGTALANMDRLRDDLPVISNSARDVANQIGQAGEVARTQLDEMVGGFNRLNEFGVASERQVVSLHAKVEQAVAAFEAQALHLEEVLGHRFATLTERSAAFRAELDGREVEAFAAIRRRADSLGQEMAESAEALARHEREALAALTERLAQVREEASRVSTHLREGEAEARERWAAEIVALEERMVEAIRKIAEIDSHASDNARRRLEALREEAIRVDQAIAQRVTDFEAERERREAQVAEREAQALASLEERLAGFDARVGERQQEHLVHVSGLAERSEALAERLRELTAQMDSLAAQGRQTQGDLGDAAAGLAANLEESRAVLAESGAMVARLTDDSVRLLELIRSSADHTMQDLPKSIGQAEARLTAFESHARSLGDLIAQAGERGEALAAHVAAARSDGSATFEELGALDARMSELAGRSGALAAQARGELSAALAALQEAATNALGEFQQGQAEAIRAIAERIGSDSSAAIAEALRDHADQAIAELEEAARQASESGRDTAQQLRDQLALVNELAGNLEQRVAYARQQAEEQVDNDFARRMALITESLNSSSIDISKAFANEVTDTAWASYLRGDRGIFTRRAVRLLDNQDARAVAEIYQGDADFRETVNRYIHDFEAMLRSVLSTRDGHTLAVTLLSSDMGKLYVALAQAIDRLRT
jgi:hypothetical protein